MARRPGEVEIAFSGAETAVEIPKGSENINLRGLTSRPTRTEGGL